MPHSFRPDSFHPESPVISMHYSSMLVDMLEKTGCQRESLLHDTGINLVDLERPDGFTTLAQFRSLFHNALHLSGDAALGLHFGERLNIASHGFLGYLIMSSENVASALDKTIKYLKIRNRLITVSISLENNRSILEFATAVRDATFNRFLIEHAVSSLNGIVKFLAGMDIEITEFRFAYPPPSYASDYADVLSGPVVFGSAASQVILAFGHASPALAFFDPQMAKMAEQQCEAMLLALNNEVSLVERIRKLLMQTPEQLPSGDKVARQIGMSPRTLSRQLKKLDTSFKAIEDGVKLDQAIDYLSATRWTIEEVASLLGYSDSSNFSRAFRKWTGQTPGQYREHIAQGNASAGFAQDQCRESGNEPE